MAIEAGIENAHELHLKCGKSYKTIKRLWDNQAPDATYDTLKAVSAAIGCTVEELENEPKKKSSSTHHK